MPPGTIEELQDYLASKNDSVGLQRLTLDGSRKFGRTYTASFYNKLSGETAKE